MTDIAQLGLRIDSSQTVAATKALDGLTAAAKPAAAAAANVEKATTNAGKGAKQLATGTGLARHEMINLSRQLQDVGVSLASGQSPFMVLAQQGAQVADIFGSSKTGTVGGALKQIVSFIGPMNLLAGGVIALGAGAALAVNSVANLGKQFDDAAKKAGTTLGVIRDLSVVASFKGIDNDEFLKGMDRFSASVYDAKSGAGGLAEVMRANGKSASDFTGYLEKAADLIKNAKDDQTRLQLLQQMGLPATMEWVKFLSQGAEGIRQAAAEAAKLDPQFAELVAKSRKFDEAWNTSWANFRRSAQNAVIDVSGWLDKLDNAGKNALMGLGVNVGANNLRNALQDRAAGLQTGSRLTGSSDVSDFYKGTGAGKVGAPPPTVDPAVLQRNIALQQQQLGIYGQTVTALEAVKQVELQVQQARLSGVSIDQKRVDVLKRLAVEQTIGVTAIKASTDAANIDAATVGMSIGKANEYAAAQNALNEARRVGRELTPENIAQIQKEAAALGQAAAQADLMRFSYESLVRGPLQTFTSAISNGASAWDAFKKAGISALNSLASKLADMAAQNLWASAFGGSGGGFNLGSLFGGSSGSTGSINIGSYSMPQFAEGTNSAPGGWSIVGEKGPELMNVPRGAQILPNGVAPGGSVTVSGGPTTIVVQGNADEKTLNLMRQELARRDAAFATNVVNTVKRAKTTRNL